MILNDPKKVAKEYEDQIQNQIEDFFAVICRIPAMRSKLEFKSFLELE